MRVVTLDDPLQLNHPVITVGTFDGVHVGHASVVDIVREKSLEYGGNSVVLTFNPHPRVIIDGPEAPGVLTSLAEKKWRIGSLGVDVLAVVPFTETLRSLSPQAFVESYLVDKLQPSAVVVGYDHGFGRDRSGGFETMRSLGEQFGFEVFSVPPILVEDKPVSSSRVRDCIRDNRIEEAVELLGAGFPIVGEVTPGEGIGRKIGFPTANVAYGGEGKLMPSAGVYAALASVPDRLTAVVNFGCRPTFNGKSRSLEAHILDFEGDLYGKEIKLELFSRLRGEQKFEHPTALVQQIQRDIDSARKILAHQEDIKH